jgi:hypothetical protein
MRKGKSTRGGLHVTAWVPSRRLKRANQPTNQATVSSSAAFALLSVQANEMQRGATRSSISRTKRQLTQTRNQILHNLIFLVPGAF